MSTHALPIVEFTVVVSDQDQKAEQEIRIDLMALEEVIENLATEANDPNGDNLIHWCRNIAPWFEEKTGCKLTTSQAYALIYRARLAFNEWKKKFDEGLRRDFGLDATPSDSATSKQESC